MGRATDLFNQPLKVTNLGIETFEETLTKQNIQTVHIDWRPPANGNHEMAKILEKLNDERIEKANIEAFNRINESEPLLVDVVYAKDVLPNMTKNTIGHAGPPLAWHDMCGPLQGAILGAIVYESLAPTLEEAEKLVLEGGVNFVSNHALGAVGPMTGMITYSMPLWKVENRRFGNVAYCTFNEGLGKVMRFGANGEDVINRLKWLEKELAPAMKTTLESSGPIALKVIMAKALAMGDEMHQRNNGATSLIIRDLMPHLVKTQQNNPELPAITTFMTGNDQFFLNIAMVASKAMMDPVKNIPYSTVVTAMSRNGTNFGIKISALGDTWFEAPVNQPEGLYFPGYSAEDANPDIGDSTIVETIGVGGFSMGASPAVVRFVGASSVQEAIQYSLDMQLITVGLSPSLIIPTMDFQGTATGIDARKVVETGILPVINTGMAHKQPGIGQVGAGIVKAPYQCFEKAINALFKQLD
ncbi:MAG: DUF1116 domain-containing protein [Candidatus Izemoplasmataceae bacterium]|jgi:hypothetical protein